MTKQDILNRLKEGNKRFISDKLEGKLIDSSRREDLTAGQNPWAIILGCADSRVIPELAFDTGLGELFVVRVAGNVANSSSIASIEYAITHLGSKVIVVLGHQSCGAVTAAIKGGDNGYNLNHLLAHIKPALSASGDGAVIEEVVRKNAELTAEELKNRSAIISSAIDKGGLSIVPAYYHLDTGKVNFL